MKITQIHEFGEVQAIELGSSQIGKPLMTVNCYIVGSTLIDTGHHHMQKKVIELIERHHIKTILLTHHHEDHSGNAAAIKSRFNIPIIGHPLTAQKLKEPFKIFPYQHWVWGAAEPLVIDIFNNRCELDSFCFDPIHTPGHSRDHTVFLEKKRGWLFSGDLYLGDQIKYFRADEKINDQITSLKKVLTYDFESLFCCHRPRPVNGKYHLSQKLQYLEDFFGQVSSLATKGFDVSAIMRELNLKEQWYVKLICFGNVSMKNMVRSVIAASVN